MLKIDVDQATRTVLLEPEGHLAKQDFQSLALFGRAEFFQLQVGKAFSWR